MMTLAIAYLRDRPLTTALNVLLLGIAFAILVLLLQFGTQSSDKLQKEADGVDLVVGAKGSPLQLILSSVFHIDQPTGNIPASSLDLLRRDPAVSRAVPLALGDNYEGYRIVGTDESFSELHQTKLAKGDMFGGAMEAVLGASVARETGAKIGQRFLGTHGLAGGTPSEQEHEHAPFETVGILEPTGTAVDRLILTSVESVWDVHGIAHDGDHEHHGEDGDNHQHSHGDDGKDRDQHNHQNGDGDGGDKAKHNHNDRKPSQTSENAKAQQSRAILQSGREGPDAELTAILVTYKNASGAIRIPAMINRQTELQAAVPASETARMLELVGSSIDGVRIFAWLLAATGGLAIFVALLNMARNREGDLALLRVMGASKTQVFSTIIFEGVITAAIGAAIGWIGAHGSLQIAQMSSATLSALGLQAWRPLAAEGGLGLAAIAIGAIAALIPALRVYKIDPARILSQS